MHFECAVPDLRKETPLLVAAAAQPAKSAYIRAQIIDGAEVKRRQQGVFTRPVSQVARLTVQIAVE